MKKPKFDGCCCGESCPYDLDGSCHAYDGYRDQDRDSGRKIRKARCVAEHGPGKTWESTTRLKRGDIIRIKGGSYFRTYTVTDVDEDRVTAVHVVNITKLSLWEVLSSEEADNENK